VLETGVFESLLDSAVIWVGLGAESSRGLDELILVGDDFLHIRLYS
jgi:hypothetical protein